MISNLTGQVAGEEVTKAAYWCKHVREAVRFADGIKTLFNEKFQDFLEIGPGTTLIGMAQQSVDDESARHWLASFRRGKDDLAQMLEALGLLYTLGAKISWKAATPGKALPSLTSLPNLSLSKAKLLDQTQGSNVRKSEG